MGEFLFGDNFLPFSASQSDRKGKMRKAIAVGMASNWTAKEGREREHDRGGGARRE